jgi:hypothetical protein
VAGEVPGHGRRQDAGAEPHGQRHPPGPRRGPEAQHRRGDEHDEGVVEESGEVRHAGGQRIERAARVQQAHPHALPVLRHGDARQQERRQADGGAGSRTRRQEPDVPRAPGRGALVGRCRSPGPDDEHGDGEERDLLEREPQAQRDAGAEPRQEPAAGGPRGPGDDEIHRKGRQRDQEGLGRHPAAQRRAGEHEPRGEGREQTRHPVAEPAPERRQEQAGAERGQHAEQARRPGAVTEQGVGEREHVEDARGLVVDRPLVRRHAVVHPRARDQHPDALVLSQPAVPGADEQGHDQDAGDDPLEPDARPHRRP